MRRHRPAGFVCLDRPVSWRSVIVTAVLLGVAAFNAPRTQNFDNGWLELHHWWTVSYLVAGVSLVVWRWTFYRPWIVTFGAFLFSAALSRSAVLYFDGAFGGAANNAILTVFAWRFTVTQGEWSDDAVD